MLTKLAFKYKGVIHSASTEKELLELLLSNVGGEEDIVTKLTSGYVDGEGKFYDNKTAIDYAESQGQLASSFDKELSLSLSPLDLCNFPS